MTGALATRAEWSAVLRRCGPVNLLQTWEYGDAKQTEGWRVQRFVLSEDEPVAAVQVLLRPIPLLGTVARINRAPLLVARDDTLAYQTERRVVRWIRDELVGCRRMAVSFAPELVGHERSAMVMADAGFERAAGPAWTSGLIDLTPDEPERRRCIDRKWRNILGKAERGRLLVDVDASAHALERFMSQHSRIQREKGFAGPDPALLASLGCGGADVRLLAWTASSAGEPVGGVLIAGHVNSATYLLAWNTSEGRTLGANYALLWRAVESCRDAGYRWFDLGGIDNQRTPGIAHFKMGMHPAVYSLSGEYWAFPRGLKGSAMRLGLAFRTRLRGQAAAADAGTSPS